MDHRTAVPRSLPRIRAALVALLALTIGSASAATLDDVLARGTVRCGVNADLAGFSVANSLGAFSGFDVDLCRAVAVAVLEDREAIEPIVTTSVDRFADLVAERFDLLSRNTTWTLDRNVRYGEFVGVTFYDGQGFMVGKRTGIRSALELDDRSICVGRGTTTEANVIDFFTLNELRYRPVYFDDETAAFTAYADGECDVITSDRSALAAQRSALDDSDAHEVLPEAISKEPLGPLVRAGDPAWENVVRWTINCLINAEELGVTSASVAREAAREPPAVRRLLGLEGDAGDVLGLSRFWCANIIATVGNYAEIYERNVGVETPIGLERGVNALWSDGGLLYAPPIQ